MSESSDSSTLWRCEYRIFSARVRERSVPKTRRTSRRLFRIFGYGGERGELSGVVVVALFLGSASVARPRLRILAPTGRHCASLGAKMSIKHRDPYSIKGQGYQPCVERLLFGRGAAASFWRYLQLLQKSGLASGAVAIFEVKFSGER